MGVLRRGNHLHQSHLRLPRSLSIRSRREDFLVGQMSSSGWLIATAKTLSGTRLKRHAATIFLVERSLREGSFDDVATRFPLSADHERIGNRRASTRRCHDQRIDHRPGKTKQLAEIDGLPTELVAICRSADDGHRFRLEEIVKRCAAVACISRCPSLYLSVRIPRATKPSSCPAQRLGTHRRRAVAGHVTEAC